MRGWEADCSHKARKQRRGGEPLQSHAGVREGTSGHCNGGTVYMTRCQATEVLPRTRGVRKARLIDLQIPIRFSGYNQLMASSDFCIGQLCRFVLSSDSLIDRSCFLVLSSDFCIWRLCRSVLSSDSLINRSCFLVLSSDFCIVRLCRPVLSKKSLYRYFIKI
jgi:hypothetical protein